MSIRPHSIHHVNVPCTDIERTKEWYAKVFGMRHIPTGGQSNTRVLIMSRGNFDIHFTPHDDAPRLAPHHFAVEVEDWDGFLAHVDSLGIRRTKITVRPQNNSKICYIHDPDRNMVELTHHGDWDHDRPNATGA
jgi:catechol 2,3-dioxygenase-like lactoylglutathione lyase family enzyme